MAPELEPEDRLPVTVQWRGPHPSGLGRDERRAIIRERLTAALADHPELAVDWDSVSVLAQTVDAKIERKDLASSRHRLEREGLRLDLMVEGQVVEDPRAD